MRLSNLFSQTLRETPTETQTASHQLLVRAGFIRQMAAGIFSYLPLARRALNKIEAILREEMDAIGGQEITMPVVLPADIWKETGRWYEIGAEMGRFKDRNDRDMVLAMTHEEAVGDLVRREIRSYRQLPQLIYHLQTKFRDDPRPRAGLVRVREFTMKDSYSLDRDWDGLDRQYRSHYQAYFNIFHRCGLPAIAVKSDTGMMGGKLAHEYMYLTPTGEDTLLLCDHCGYAANRQVARFARPAASAEALLPVEKVHTPGTKTIESLAAFLKIPESKTAKVVFMVASLEEDGAVVDRLVMGVVRGDMELNETKLSNAIKARELRPAQEEEIRASGAVAGFASPVGLTAPLVVVDELVAQSANLVSGANESDYHLMNVNYGRDYQAQVVTDLVAARQGDPCPQCGQSMHAERGVEVGNIFQLGTRYSAALGCYYQDENGESHPVIMGSYGIGVGRLLACVAEEHHDEHGLIWPASVAPFQVHLVLLPGKNDPRPAEVAEALYRELRNAGIEVLFDDRNESPGVKLNDADLIGLPLRIT
ncbi:MAG TPA: proline--tRNA ligase, partial [Anaerolineaceae bacterium]|nr:proline--tRNA ligase [Anaerolineaceae bacterium]